MERFQRVIDREKVHEIDQTVGRSLNLDLVSMRCSDED